MIKESIIEFNHENTHSATEAERAHLLQLLRNLSTSTEVTPPADTENPVIVIREEKDSAKETNASLDEIKKTMKKIASAFGGMYTLLGKQEENHYIVGVIIPFIFLHSSEMENHISFDELLPLCQCESVEIRPLSEKFMLIAVTVA